MCPSDVSSWTFFLYTAYTKKMLVMFVINIKGGGYKKTYYFPLLLYTIWLKLKTRFKLLRSLTGPFSVL
jgi:hypothetical protein